MSAPVNHWKLGFFVLLVAGAVIGAVIGLGECSTHHETAAFTTYFDESVGGITGGGRVAFRGVDVGSISRISIAPDHRHIEVAFDVDTDSLPKMGITRLAPDGGARYAVPPDLRAQIGGNGLTGVKYVLLDLFPPRDNPPPVLPFPAPPNYIPSVTSTMTRLEDALTKAADRVPKLVDAVATASARVDGMLAELQRARVPDRAVAVLQQADVALGAVRTTIRRFDRERVPEKTSQALSDVGVAVAKMNRVLDQLEGERGLIASIGRATDAFGQAGRGVSSSTRDIDQALDELRDAADAIRVLAQDLDRDPDMLLKGRASRQPR